TVGARQLNRRMMAARMPADVGEAFLHDAKQRHLDWLRETANFRLRLQIDLDAAAFGEAFEVPLERARQAVLVKHWRMQDVGEGADLAETFFGEQDGFVERVDCLRVGWREALFDTSQIERDGAEVLRGDVVKFAGDVPAFLILKLEQAAGKLV